MEILTICAIQEEFIDIHIEGAEIRTLCAGVGKTQSAYQLTKALCERKPDLVINYGTAGTTRHAVGDIIVCNRFIDRDLEHIKLYGVSFQQEFAPIDTLSIFNKVKTYGTCNTGDRFVTDITDLEGDVVDMEAYAEALVCKEMGVPFVAVKYVTDIIGQNSIAIWENKLADARSALRAFFQDR